MVRPAMLLLLLPLACSGAGGPRQYGGQSGRQSGASPCADPSATAPIPTGCGLVCRAEIPITFAASTPLASVWIDGKPAQLILDTGAGSTVLSTGAAARLGLDHATPAPGRLVGIGGEQARATVAVRSLAVSYLRRDGLQLPVAVMGRPKGETPPDGVLGDDILHDYEVDLDMPHRVVRLYQGRPCPGPLPGWAQEDGTLPFNPGRPGHHVIVPVALDGRATDGLIDSGSEVVVVNRTLAIAAGTPQGELSSDLDAKLFGLGPNQVPGSLHRFDSLQVGAERLAPVETAVIDLPFRAPDVILGEDYLQSHKVWISYATGQVHLAHAW